VAQVDDRDMAQVLAALRIDGQPAERRALLAWLEEGHGTLTLSHASQDIAVQPLAYAKVAQTFAFQQAPTARNS
jgi:hypothetical protein